MSKYTLSEFISLKGDTESVTTLKENLLFQALEKYLEQEDPPSESLRIIREIMSLEMIEKILPTLKERNSTAYFYYLKEEAAFRANILIEKLKEKSLREEITVLEELAKEGDYKQAIRDLERIDAIYEKYKMLKTAQNV